MQSLFIARILTISTLIALLFSPPITTILESIIILLFITSKELHNKTLQCIKQPIVISATLFATILLLSTLNSLVSWSEGMRSFWSWHKLLLLPISIVLFDEKIWKTRLVLSFVVVATICAAISFISSYFDFTIYKYPSGIIIRNHATQGIIFSVAAFALISPFLQKEYILNKKQKLIYIIFSTLLITNIIYITPGRSGYLALIILSALTAFKCIYTNKKPLIPIAVLTAIFIGLLNSSNVTNRISQGMNEVTSYNNSAEATSMGLRMVLWKNTLDLISERPIFGYGTGGFEKAYQAKIVDQPEWHNVIIHDPHNQFLKIATEQGIIGLLVFLGWISSIFWQKPSQTFFFIGFGTLLVWCANSLFSSHFSTFSEGRFIFLWCGVMFANERPSQSTNNQIKLKD